MRYRFVEVGLTLDCSYFPARRRRSSLLPVLNRLASLGLSVNSQTDLTKATYEPPTPHDSDDDEIDSTYVPSISRMSSVSLDDYHLGRTMSNSTVSTLPVSPRQSVNSLGEDNPVFEDIICQNPNGESEVGFVHPLHMRFKYLNEIAESTYRKTNITFFVYFNLDLNTRH